MAKDTLRELEAGESALITKIGGEGALRQHFLDMGLIPGTKVKVIKFAPMGDPMEVKLRGYGLTLRLDDAAKIEVDVSPEAEEEEEVPFERKKSDHPGLGEGGKYHVKEEEDPLPAVRRRSLISLRVPISM